MPLVRPAPCNDLNVGVTLAAMDQQKAAAISAQQDHEMRSGASKLAPGR